MRSNRESLCDGVTRPEPTRRSGQRAAPTVALGLLWLCTTLGASAAAGNERGQPVPRPNVVFILADDLGYGDLGCYGQRLIQTPRLDRMAREGTRFTQCYAGSPVCAPSRDALMTGRHTGHSRFRDNSPRVGGVVEEHPQGQRRLWLEAEDVTAAEVLKSAGYVTGAVGKWGLGEAGTAGVPNRQGFDEWFGYLNQNHAADYYTTYLWKNESRYELAGNRDGRREQYTHDLFTEFALDFIRRHRHEPFFLYVAYTIPHEKLEVPELEPYAERPWPELAKVYAAMITRLDRDVGRLLDLLGELGLESSTLVFFSSDNGAPRKASQEFFSSGGGLRGGKGELFEGGLRVPMIVRWPGKVPAGRVSDVPWYFPDVLPTLARLAGARAPACDGVDVSKLLTGARDTLPARFLYWEYPKRGLNQAVRWKNWKAIRLAGEPKLALFDLAHDPAEQHDLAAARPAVVSRIEKFLKTARRESPHWPSEVAARAE